ncbi:MAG TPA: GntR family transcriptional regulator [Planctomycetota bacterium]
MRLRLRLDPGSGVPAYRQVQDQIRFLVAGSALQTGEELPSTRALAQTLGLDPMTVSRAYAELAREGVLQRRPGRAMVVRARATRRRDEARRAELEAELRSAAFAADRLGFAVEEALAVYQRLLERER